MKKIELGEFILDKDVYDIYVRNPGHEVGLKEVCEAIDKGGGQTCDINGVLKYLNLAGFVVRSK